MTKSQKAKRRKRKKELLIDDMKEISDLANSGRDSLECRLARVAEALIFLLEEK